MWIWARESGEGKGDHVHILLHVAPLLAQAFGNRQRGWLAACGVGNRRGVIKSRPIGLSYRAAGAGPPFGEAYTLNLLRTVDYVLKGADNRTAEALGLLRKRSIEGTLEGKRVATSQSLGRKARIERQRIHPPYLTAQGATLDQIRSLSDFEQSQPVSFT